MTKAFELAQLGDKVSVDGSGNVSVDTNTLFVDAANNRIGVGTSSPDHNLHVFSSSSVVSSLETTGTASFALLSVEADVGYLDNRAYGSAFAGTLFGSSRADLVASYAVGASVYAVGTNNAAPLVFGTNNTERMRIDSSGNLLLGRTDVGFDVEAIVFRERGEAYITSDGRAPLLVNRLTSDGEIVSFRKNGNAVGSIGVVAGDNLVVHSSQSGHFGLEFGSVGIAPTNNSGSPVDNTVDMGTATYRFDDIYATNGTIQTSDRNEKQDIEALSEAEQRVAVAAKGLLRKFRWKDAVAEKGDDARIHFGIIAQDLQAAFEAEGLDAGRYAMFIHSTWVDEETGEERSRMGVRYPQLLAFIIAAI